MPKHCSIPGCTSRSNKEECKGLSFYKLPTDTEERHRWLVSIKKPITVSPYTYICSLHFKNTKKAKDVPTIFPWTPSVSARKSPVVRPFVSPAPQTKKHKVEEDLSKQLQSYTESYTKLQEKYLQLEKRLQSITEELEKMKVSHIERFGIQRVQGSDEDIQFYTGLPSYSIFISIYRYLEPLLQYLRYRPSKHTDVTHQLLSRQRLLQPIDEFFLVLLRLRLSLLEKDLGHRFNCSVSTISRICTAWLPFLSTQLYPLITWPSRELIDLHMPKQFKEIYPSTRVIIDCTELFIETPSSLNIQSSTWSSYKHHNTFKGLIGISPTGACIFVSNLYTGGISDQELTRHCGLLDLIESGDSVMADKGFDISYDLLIRGCRLNMPPFVKGGRLSKSNVTKTRKIASLRIHVERAIGRIKQYRILSSVIPLSISPYVNSIWFICCALTLFHPPLVVDVDKLSDADLSRIKLMIDSELES